MTSAKREAPPYDLTAALAYIETLSPEPPRLRITNVADALIQPTVGTEAAALLEVLILSRRPQRVLEIGTSLGFSACVMGRAAQSYGGQVRTIEIDERLVEAAQQNVAAAGLERTVMIESADARTWIQHEHGPYGLIVQDGGKEDYLSMLDRLIELLEPGGLLISDDVLFPIMELPPRVEHWKQAIADYNRALATHPRLRTAWLPIGDGVAISVKCE